MCKLHYFNPGHETAVLQGKVSFTPSRNVRKMISDLSLLPLWYADHGDYVLTEGETPDLSFLSPELKPENYPVNALQLKENKEQLPCLKATPWGISPSVLHQMQQLKEQTGILLELPRWQDDFIRLTGRPTAANCLEKIKQQLPDIIFPETPFFAENIEEIKRYLQLRNGGCLIKTPYSSSGRGLLWLENNKLTIKEEEWIRGAIRKQHSVSIEPIVCKVADYGWEFFTDGKGAIRYEGISPFHTNKNGSFVNNRVGRQQKFTAEIYRVIPEAVYNKIIETVTEVIRETYAYQYEGCIGVDIMIYKDTNGAIRLHPCVEINMRYTMGYLSLSLEKIVHPDSEATFRVTYHTNPADCYREHLEMQKTDPLQLKEGKIEKGYLSLCPVTPHTNYKAILVSKKFGKNVI